MDLAFAPITREQAAEGVGWTYDPPYDLYNVPEAERAVEVAGMLEGKTFAVCSEGELIGLRSFGDDGKVEGGEYDDAYQDTGGALRPDKTGQGLGGAVLKAGLQFGRQQFGFLRYRVTVAGFNQRALTVCRRVGFVVRQRFRRASDGLEFVVLTLDNLDA